MSTDSNAILIVDDDEDIRTALKLLLGRHYARVDVCADPQQIPEKLNQLGHPARHEFRPRRIQRG
jgi:DNA-binding response OmpR family regulator